MNRRGFTLVELLVAVGITGLVLGIVASATRTQGRSAVFQMGTADMQQNVRGALQLFKSELRMAGYGMSSVPADVLAPVEVPDSADQYQIVLRGNYQNIASRGSALAGTSTITLDPTMAPFPMFVPGERVAIESALLAVAEVRVIAAYNPATGTISVDEALDNDYGIRSPVNQIDELTYRLDDQDILWRSGTLVADQLDALALEYVLADGTVLMNPAGNLDTLRSATIRMHAELEERHGLKPQAELETEVRIRNLGIAREPGVGT